MKMCTHTVYFSSLSDLLDAGVSRTPVKWKTEEDAYEHERGRQYANEVCTKIQMIPAVMKLEEEADEESVGFSQVSPSGIHTRARLTVFHHQHAGSERVTQKLLSERVCMGIKLEHIRAQTACSPHHEDKLGHRITRLREERSVYKCVCALQGGSVLCACL